MNNDGLEDARNSESSNDENVALVRQEWSQNLIPVNEPSFHPPMVGVNHGLGEDAQVSDHFYYYL